MHHRGYFFPFFVTDLVEGHPRRIRIDGREHPLSDRVLDLVHKRGDLSTRIVVQHGMAEAMTIATDSANREIAQPSRFRRSKNLPWHQPGWRRSGAGKSGYHDDFLLEISIAASQSCNGRCRRKLHCIRHWFARARTYCALIAYTGRMVCVSIHVPGRRPVADCVEPHGRLCALRLESE